MKRQLFQTVLEARRQQRAVVLLSRLDGSQTRLWSPGEPLEEPLAAAAARALATDDAFVPEAAPDWFVQPYNPPLRLVLIGAVHIAEALATLAQIAGYAVTLIDPREGFAKREILKGLTVLAEWPDEVLPAMHLDHRTAVVTLTHDPKIDDPALELALNSPAFYIGALGSGKTHASRLKRLAQSGFSEAALGRIHGPVGLKIGARTPAEIAVSVLAEMTSRLRLGKAG